MDLATKVPRTPEEVESFRMDVQGDYFYGLPDHPECSLILELVSQLGEMPTTSRISMCVVVAAHEEERFIPQFLNSLRGQTAPADSWEAVLFLNHPDRDKQGNVIVPDRTALIVREFQRDNPDVPIKVCHSTLPREEATISRIRKLVTDATGLRAFRRTVPHSEEMVDDLPSHCFDYQIIQMDADTRALHPQFIETYIERFDAHPTAYAVRGRMDWDWERLASHPLLLFSQRIEGVLDRYIRAENGEVYRGSGGPGYAFRLSGYCMADGYNPFDSIAEDVAIGKGIECGLGTVLLAPEEITVLGGARTMLWTSTRRAECALERHVPVNEMWTGNHYEHSFGVVNGAVRGNLPPRIDDSEFEGIITSPTFRRDVNTMLNRIVGDPSDPQERANREEMISEVLTRHLGLKITASPRKGILSIKNFERVQDYLRWFRRHAMDRLARIQEGNAAA